MTATLEQLVRYDYGLRVFCGGCQRCADLDVDALAERYGVEMPLLEIGQRARCEACGHRGSDVQVVAST